jgi:hypothetical protein
MTIVLTPYWTNGVQKLKIVAQRTPKHFFDSRWLPIWLTTKEESKRGLTPPALQDAVHALRCLAQLRSKDKNIEKYIYLSALKDHDPPMFYRLCLENMPEITPLIYTPTVGDACLQYSHNYRRPEGLVSTASFHAHTWALMPFLVHIHKRQREHWEWSGSDSFARVPNSFPLPLQFFEIGLKLTKPG